MLRTEHIALDEIVFSRGFNEVHAWLDECYPKYRGYEHWKERHHLEAIEAKYGSQTIEYQVAYLHILSDWLSHWGLIKIPKNSEEVMSELKKVGAIR